MKKILACIDGSSYSDSVCAHAAWVSARLGAGVELLNVLPDAHAEPSHADLSGAIGLGANSGLFDQLATEDEAHAQEVLRAGRRIIAHAEEQLRVAGVAGIVSLKRRGGLAEIICELESDIELIVLGKRGRYADEHASQVVSNLEPLARSVHRPLLVTTSVFCEPERFLIALDGDKSSAKALDYIIDSPLLKGIACHAVTVCGNEGRGDEKCRAALDAGAARLRGAGFEVQASVLTGHPDEAIHSYLGLNKIGLLVIGAYGHSRIRNLIKGSTTTSMITSCKIPLLLFR